MEKRTDLDLVVVDHMSIVKVKGEKKNDARVDEMYENNKANHDKSLEDVHHIEAIIAKQRNGRTGIANLFFFRQTSRYEVPSKQWEEQAVRTNSWLEDTKVS